MRQIGYLKVEFQYGIKIATQGGVRTVYRPAQYRLGYQPRKTVLQSILQNHVNRVFDFCPKLIFKNKL